MIKKYGLLSIIIALFMAGCTASVSAESVDKLVSRSQVPAVSVAAVKNQQSTFYSNHSGIDEDKLFCIGSLSKAFTGLGLLLLEEEGKLSLDDPLEKYLPSFTANYAGENVAGKLTLKMLLYQTSGFLDDETELLDAQEAPSLKVYAEMVSGQTLLFSPGQEFSYSNMNYNLLGRVIEIAARQSYGEFMTKAIFQPLGLNSTDAQVSAKTANVVKGSQRTLTGHKEYDLPVYLGVVPAGFIFSNSKDMLRWARIQMEQVALPKKFADLVQRSHEIGCAFGVDSGYGAGWIVSNGGKTLSHSGNVPNYAANIVIEKPKKLAVIVLANQNDLASIMPLTDQIMAVLAGNAEDPSFAETYKKQLTFGLVIVICIGLGLWYFVRRRRLSNQ